MAIFNQQPCTRINPQPISIAPSLQDSLFLSLDVPVLCYKLRTYTRYWRKEYIAIDNYYVYLIIEELIYLRLYIFIRSSLLCFIAMLHRQAYKV